MYTAPPHRHLLCGAVRIPRNAPVLYPCRDSFLVFVEIQDFQAAGKWRRPISVQFLFLFQFSYVVKPGGPEWGKRRLWAAQGVFRAVQTGAKDLDLTAAS